VLGRGAATILALLGLVSCGGSTGPVEGGYLIPVAPGSLLNSLQSVTPGTPVFFDVYDADWRPNNPQIHLLKVEVLGLPKQLVIDRIGAINIETSRQPGISEVATAADGEAHLLPLMVPVDHVTIGRDCLHGGNALCPGWYVVGEIHATAAGVYRSSGVRVWYEANGHTYFQDFGLLIGISSTTEAPELPRS
jgi:hypothetical protein